MVYYTKNIGYSNRSEGDLVSNQPRLLELREQRQLTPAQRELAVERYGTVNEILEKAVAHSSTSGRGFCRKAPWRWAPPANQSTDLTISIL